MNTRALNAILKTILSPLGTLPRLGILRTKGVVGALNNIIGSAHVVSDTTGTSTRGVLDTNNTGEVKSATLGVTTVKTLRRRTTGLNGNASSDVTKTTVVTKVSKNILHALKVTKGGLFRGSPTMTGLTQATSEVRADTTHSTIKLGAPCAIVSAGRTTSGLRSIRCFAGRRKGVTDSMTSHSSIFTLSLGSTGGLKTSVNVGISSGAGNFFIPRNSCAMIIGSGVGKTGRLSNILTRRVNIRRSLGSAVNASHCRSLVSFISARSGSAASGFTRTTELTGDASPRRVLNCTVRRRVLDHGSDRSLISDFERKLGRVNFNSGSGFAGGRVLSVMGATIHCRDLGGRNVVIGPSKDVVRGNIRFSGSGVLTPRDLLSCRGDTSRLTRRQGKGATFRGAIGALSK